MARPRTVSDTTILAAAAAAVGAHGPGDVTLAQIGDRAGLTAAALLRRFGSKRGLLLALARHGADTLPARLAAAGTPAQLIEAFAGMAAGLTSAREFAHHLSFLLLDLSDPEFQQITRDYAAAVEAAVATVLHTAPGDPLPRAVHATYNGALITWGMSGADTPPADEVRTQLTHLLHPRLTTPTQP